MASTIQHTEQESAFLTDIYNAPFAGGPERAKNAFKGLLEHMGIKTRDEAFERIDRLEIAFLHLSLMMGEYPSFFTIQQAEDTMFDYAFGEHTALDGKISDD